MPDICRNSCMLLYTFIALQMLMAQEPSACSWDELQSSCDSIRTHIKKLADEKSPKLKVKSFEDKKPELDKTFNKVKASMLELILDGRDRSQLSATEEAMYVKMSTVRMISPAQGSGYSCEGRSQLNGRYFSDMHAFTICPGFEFLPESAYLSSMAHELAHVIDPCMSQFGLVRLKMNRLDDAKQSGRFDAFIQSEIEDWKKDPEDYNHRVRGQHPRTVHTWRGKYSNKTIEGLKSVGLLEDLAPGISMEEYPFKKVISCLQSSGVKSVADNLPKRDEVKDAVYPHCPGRVLGAMSQVPESMSDVVAGKVLGKLLKDSAPSGVQKPMTFWLFVQKACLSTEPEKTNANVYVSTKERVDKLILSSKELREAFNCPPSQAKDCSEQFKSSQRDKPSSQYSPQAFGGQAVEK